MGEEGHVFANEIDFGCLEEGMRGEGEKRREGEDRGGEG